MTDFRINQSLTIPHQSDARTDTPPFRSRLRNPAVISTRGGVSRVLMGGPMIGAVAFMIIAAIRAEASHSCRFDDPDPAEHYANSAIRMASAGLACLVAEKVFA